MKKYSKSCYSSGGQIMPGDIKTVTEKKGLALGGSVGGGPGDPKIKLNYKQKEQLNSTAPAGSSQYKETLQEATGIKRSSAPAGSSTWNKAKTANEAAVKSFNSNNTPTSGLNTPKTDSKYSAIAVSKAIAPDADSNAKLTKYTDKGQDRSDAMYSKDRKTVDRTSVFKSGLAKGGIVAKIKMKKC